MVLMTGPRSLTRNQLLNRRPWLSNVASWQIEWPLFFAKNLTLRTGLVNPQVYIPRLLPWIEEGRLDPTEIISHRFSLEDGAQAYRMFAEHRDDVLKVVLEP